MKFTYSLLFFCGALASAFGQRSEAGLMLGASVYSGDLSPQFVNVKFIKPAGSVFYRYNLNYHWALKGAISIGSVIAYDSESSEVFQKNRNLNFKSTILDFSGLVEFNFLEYETGDKKRPFTPYIFSGIAIFDFNPMADYNGEWVELHPLGTEGQRLASATKSQYSLVQLAIPLGLGVKYSVGRRLSIGAELSTRKTFTDYLDDVSGEYADKKLLLAEQGKLAADLSDRSLNQSLEKGRQRGNSPDTDWFTFAGITLAVKIGKTSKVNCTPFSGK